MYTKGDMIFIKKKGPWRYGAEVGAHRFLKMNKINMAGKRIGYAIPISQEFSELENEEHKKPFFIEDSYKL